jgi:hypothetical protein
LVQNSSISARLDAEPAINWEYRICHRVENPPICSRHRGSTSRPDECGARCVISATPFNSQHSVRCTALFASQPAVMGNNRFAAWTLKKFRRSVRVRPSPANWALQLAASIPCNVKYEGNRFAGRVSRQTIHFQPTHYESCVTSACVSNFQIPQVLARTL